jgi:energy-coupling factor transport system substrate-specific component
MKALGMIEVYGYLAAVEALDSALKAANVTMVDVSLVKGGLVTVLITGDVGAVKAAMDASRSAAWRVGKVISVHVIPRPSEQVEKMLPFHSPDTPTSPKLPQAPDKQEYITPSDSEKLQSEQGIHLKEIEQKAEAKYSDMDHNHITRDQMEEMTVVQLRTLARELRITNMTKKHIRSATKHELIESISQFIEQER